MLWPSITGTIIIVMLKFYTILSEEMKTKLQKLKTSEFRHHNIQYKDEI